MLIHHAQFHFHGELNFFLPSPQQDQPFEHPVGHTDTLKHVIESIGVPHPEIGRVTCNGIAAHLSEPACAGARIDVYGHTLPIHLATPDFVLDGHLGRLAAYLRMLGLNTWYQRDADDPLLASISSNEHRLLLTRDVGLLKRREVEHGYCIRNHKPHAQLREVTHRFALQQHLSPFTRCMDCNGELVPVPKSEVFDVLPPHTQATKEEFSRCLQCEKVFWRGSHHARMLAWIDDLQKSDQF